MKLPELQQRSLEAIGRFLLKTRYEDGCVVWAAGLTHQGYGRFKVGGKNYRAHRLSYAWANNVEIPAGMLVCHSCDNPKCVYPDHLWLGTDADNNKDARQKGRAVKPPICAKRNRKRALTAEQAAEIKALPRKYKMLDELVAKYQVSRRIVRMARGANYRG